MKVVFLLLCLVLVIVSSDSADQEDAELSRDAGVVMDRQVREAGQKGKNASRKRKKNVKVSRKYKSGKGKKNAKVSRKDQSGKGKKNAKVNRKDNTGKGKKNAKVSRKINQIQKQTKKSNNVNKRKNMKGRKKGKKRSKKTKSKGKVQGKRRKKNNKENKKQTKKTNYKRAKKNFKGENKVKQTQSNSSNSARQTDTECFKNLCEKSKKFNLYQTQMRKAKRIQTWVDQMGKKKEKAMTTFQNASSAIKNATSNGRQCDGGSIPGEAKTADETLENCSTTASGLCSSSKISGLNTSLITECVPKLKSYVDAYKACLKSCECSCFTALTLVDDSCTKFNDMESSTKVAKKKCTSPTEKGSFGDCRQQERKVAYYGEKCKKCTASMTTKAPSVVAGFLKQRQFQRLAGRM